MPQKPHRIHDLKTVHTDFKIVLKLLKTGYKLTKDEKNQVLSQLEKALALLQTEISRQEEEKEC